MKTWRYEPKKVKKAQLKKDKNGDILYDENDEPIDEEIEIDNPFSGFIEIQVPTYVERTQYGKKFDINKKDPKATTKYLQAAEDMFNLCEKHTKKVDLKLKEKPITSLEDLGYYAEGAAIIQDLGNVLVQGIPVGEN